MSVRLDPVNDAVVRPHLALLAAALFGVGRATVSRNLRRLRETGSSPVPGLPAFFFEVPPDRVQGAHIGFRGGATTNLVLPLALNAWQMRQTKKLVDLGHYLGPGKTTV